MAKLPPTMEWLSSRTLHGWALKLNRANQLLRELSSEIDWYGSAGPVRCATEPDRDSPGKYRILVDRIDPVPLKLAALVGDCVQNYRAALDHMVWLLAGTEATQQTEFPIFGSRSKYGQARSKRLAGLTDGQKRLIDTFQPLEDDPDREQYKPLRNLHLLSNEDKHRRIYLMALSGKASHLGVANLNIPLFEPARAIEEGMQLGSYSEAELRLAAGIGGAQPLREGPRANIRVGLKINVAFGSGPLEGLVVLDVLNPICDLTLRVLTELDETTPMPLSNS